MKSSGLLSMNDVKRSLLSCLLKLELWRVGEQQMLSYQTVESCSVVEWWRECLYVAMELIEKMTILVMWKVGRKVAKTFNNIN